MPFPLLPHQPPGLPPTGAFRLSRLIAVLLGVLLLWTFSCAGAHHRDSHPHDGSPASADGLLPGAKSAEWHPPAGSHQPPGPACTAYPDGQLPPQAKGAPTHAAAAAAVVAVTTAATDVTVLPRSARPGSSRSLIRRSGRCTLSVVCRWRI